MTMAPLAVLGELRLGQVKSPLQLLHLPCKRLDALRLCRRQRECLVARRPGSRLDASAGRGSWGGRTRRRAATILCSRRHVDVDRARCRGTKPGL